MRSRHCCHCLGVPVQQCGWLTNGLSARYTSALRRWFQRCRCIPGYPPDTGVGPICTVVCPRRWRVDRWLRCWRHHKWLPGGCNVQGPGLLSGVVRESSFRGYCTKCCSHPACDVFLILRFAISLRWTDVRFDRPRSRDCTRSSRAPWFSLSALR